MAEDELVKVTVAADVGPYIRETGKAAEATKKVGVEVDKVTSKSKVSAAAWATAGTAVTLFGAKAVRGLNQATQAASDLSESTTKSQQIFGASAGAIERYASTSAQALGMSKRSALDAASTMATFGKAAGLTGQDLTKFSTDMVTLSGDLASFYNSSPEQAMEAIGAALRGEAEPIRQYGVLLDDATLRQRAFEMGLISSTKNALTPQQRALAAQKEILAQTADAQGDYARTADGLANTQRRATAEFEDAKAQLGEALLPVMTDAASTAADLAHAFSQLPKPLQETATVLMGVVAAAALIGPGLTATYRGITAATGAWQAYKVASVEAAAADVAGSTARTASMAGLARSLGLIGLALAGVATAATVVKSQIDGVHSEQVDGMVQSLKDAQAAGQQLGSTLQVTFGGGETAIGIEAIAAAAGRSEVKAKQAAPAFAALDAYLQSLGTRDAAAAHDRLAESVGRAGMSVERLDALLPGYSANAKAAADAQSQMGGSAQGAAAGVGSLTASTQEGAAALFGYLGALNAVAGARLQTASIGDSLAAHLQSNSTASVARSASAARATDGESKALQRKADAIRKADKADEEAEIAAARRRAKRKAEARADAGARADVQKGVAEAIATDKAARAGKDIDGTRQTGSVGEASGDLTTAEQKALDKRIEAIRARHKKSVDAQVKALGEASKALGGASKAQRDFATATDNASRSLDIHTAAGRKNLEWLQQQGATALQVGQTIYDAAIKRGDSEEAAGRKARRAIEEYRQGLVDAMTQAGFSRDAVLRYLKTLGLTPKTIKTKFEIDTKPAKLALDELADWIRKHHPEVSAEQARAQAAMAGRYGSHRAGGYISGPGSKTSDSIVARLSNGEYVMRAAAVDHYGHGFMDAVNARAFAYGGPVSPRTFYGTASAGSSSVTHGPSYGMYFAPGAVTVTEATPARMRVAVMDTLAEQAYRSGGVR